MSNKIIQATVILVLASSVHAAESPDPADPNRYLNAVREFADNVLKYGRDTYWERDTSYDALWKENS